MDELKPPRNPSDPPNVQQSTRMDPKSAIPKPPRTPGPPISPAIDDEIIRCRIRALMDEKSKRSRVEAISKNPLVAVLLGFVLTGIVGGYLASRYAREQQDLVARRSFSDEINKTKVQKLAEVWEQLDSDELAINDILEERRLKGPDKDPAVNSERLADITKRIRSDQTIATKYRFWLGEPMYKTTMGYLDASIDYAATNISSKPGADLSEFTKRRDALREQMLQFRSALLAGEPNPQEKPTPK
jgi:cell division protein FtsB